MSDTCTTSVPASSNCVPSPEPPWSRARVHVVTQTIGEAGNVSLTADPTYLEKQVSTPSVPVAITIPDGNSVNQSKTIYIKKANLETTETFILSGTFSGFTQLQFDAVGHSAILMWDGSSWKFIAGTATEII